MANRKRNIQMKFYVTEEKKRLIDEKMAQLPTRRYGAYLRKMAIDGYIIYTDTTDIKEMAYKHEMLNQFRSHLPHTDFVFMSGLHLPGRKEYRALTQEINRQLSAWAQQEPQLHFVDADAMTLTGTTYHDELFVEDMIHLNHEGQLRWANDYILPAIEILMN